MPALHDLHSAILAAVSALSHSREMVDGPEFVAQLRKVGRDDACDLIALRIAELHEDGLLTFRRSMGTGSASFSFMRLTTGGREVAAKLAGPSRLPRGQRELLMTMAADARGASRHEQRWRSHEGQLDGPGGTRKVLSSDVGQLHKADLLHAESLNYLTGNWFVLTEQAWAYAEAAWRRDATAAEHEQTGWEAVDVAVGKLRERMAAATDVHDFKAVGHQCVTALEILGREIFDPKQHLPEGTPPPSRNDFKRKVELVIEADACGSNFANVRKIARAAYEQGQEIKHRSSPDAIDAGVSTDAVILLVAMLRKLGGRP
jgi:hypothetical protein